MPNGIDGSDERRVLQHCLSSFTFRLQLQKAAFSSWQFDDMSGDVVDVFVVEYNWMRPMPFSIQIRYHSLILVSDSRVSRYGCFWWFIKFLCDDVDVP